MIINDNQNVGYFSSTGSIYNNELRIYQKVINLQLAHWIEAKKKYFELKNKSECSWDDILIIINNLGDSISYLFGMNYEQKQHTPDSKKFIDKIFPSKGWDLKSDDAKLYDGFNQLHLLYIDKTKHMNRLKIEDASKLTFDDLSMFMDITQKIWIWFMNKNLNSNIPEGLLEEFKDKFI